jgi:hypothetical protein
LASTGTIRGLAHPATNKAIAKVKGLSRVVNVAQKRLGKPLADFMV